MDNKFSNRTTNHTGDVHFEIVSYMDERVRQAHRPGTGSPAVDPHGTGTLALALARVVGCALEGLARCRDSAIATAEEPTLCPRTSRSG